MREHLNDETFQAYLDDELARPERAKLEAHLQVCSDCAAELTQLRSLFSSIESLPSEPLATDLAPNVMAAIQPRSSWLPSIAVGELVAAAALTLALVLWLGGGELQARFDSAGQLLIGQLEVATVGLSTTLNDLINQVPEIPEFGVFELNDLLGTVFFSRSTLWAVSAVALALLLLGNGLVLRTGKDRNV